MSPARFRSVTHNTCALNGKHESNDRYRSECPVLRATRRVKKKTAEPQKTQQGGTR